MGSAMLKPAKSLIAPSVYKQEKRSKILELWSWFVAPAVYNQEKRSKILGLWSRFVAPAVRSENLGQAGVTVCCVCSLQSRGKMRNLGLVVNSLQSRQRKNDLGLLLFIAFI